MSTPTPALDSMPYRLRVRSGRGRLSMLLSILALTFVVTACGASDAGEPVSAGAGDEPTDANPTAPATDANNDDDQAEPVVPDETTVPPSAEAPLGAGPYPIADLTIEYTHAQRRSRGHLPHQLSRRHSNRVGR